MRNCMWCTWCNECHKCSMCTLSHNIKFCVECSQLKNCNHCYYSNTLLYCDTCWNCSTCTLCTFCYNCTNMLYCVECKKCTYCFCSCECTSNTTHHFNGLQTDLDNRINTHIYNNLTLTSYKYCPSLCDVKEVIEEVKNNNMSTINELIRTTSVHDCML